MDEATASVDNESDNLIQGMLREKFNNNTVLTIAHRLGTIGDSDRVAVFDNGCIVEFDAPLALISKKGEDESLFGKMWRDGGYADK